MSATVNWPRRSIGSSCQTGKMAALLNSLLFVFKISVLPKYHVIYYEKKYESCAGGYKVIGVYRWILPKL